MDGFLVGQVAPLGDLDRIDLADQIGDRNVGGGQLLGVALVAADPFDFQFLAGFGQLAPAFLADRRHRTVIDLASLDRRHPFVEQVGQRSDDARLGLPAFAQEHHVMPGEDAVFDLGNDRVFVTENPRHQALLVAQQPEQIVAHLNAHRLDLVAGPLEFAHGSNLQQALVHKGALVPHLGYGTLKFSEMRVEPCEAGFKMLRDDADR